MAKIKMVTPFLKWVGGKRQIMPAIIELMPKKLNSYTYVEPFVGGGAVLFEMQPKKAIINDYNAELINAYQVVKENVTALIKDLKIHENTPEYFYEMRHKDRLDTFNELTAIERASRFIYLNKTCFNGLYRVNNAGKFNTPFGRYKNPNIVNAEVLRAVSKFLNTRDIKILNTDYENVIRDLDSSHFVYFDPPYHPLSESSSFTSYVQGGWGEDDQTRLRDACLELNKRKVKFVLSNSSSKFILDLYKHKDFRITTVRATRMINANPDKRGEVDEVLIRNYR